MKKFVSLLLTVVLVFSVSSAIFADQEGGYNFNISESNGEKYAELVSYSGTEDVIIVPSQLGGYPVLSIRIGAFYNSIATKIVFPPTVTNFSFSGPGAGPNIKEVVFSEGTISLEEHSAYYENEVRITLPKSVNSIHKNAFNKEKATLVVYKNSYAWRFAVDNEFKYEIIRGSGDINNSGKVDLSDAMLCFIHVAGKSALSAEQLKQAAVGGTGNVNLSDAMLIFQFVAGKFESFDKPYDQNNSGPCGKYAQWSLSDDGTLTITGSGDMYDFTVMSTHDPFDPDIDFITKNKVPWDKDKINKVIVGEGITTVGGGAFAFLPNLKTAIIGKDVQIIGSQSFYQSSLENIIMQEGVTLISDYAFTKCKNLKNINLPSSVTLISYLAFAASGLESFELTENVISLSSDAFWKCNSLNEIKVSEKNPYFEIKDGMLYNEDFTSLILCPAGKQAEKYVIGPRVFNIEPYTFFGCNKIQSIVFPENTSTSTLGGYTGKIFCVENSIQHKTAVEKGLEFEFIPYVPYEAYSFGNDYFSKKAYIYKYTGTATEITLPTHCSNFFYNTQCLVTGIGTDAFKGNTSVKKITVPGTFSSMGGGFVGCTSLEEIVIEKGELKTIGFDIIDKCTSLKRFVIPESVISIIYMYGMVSQEITATFVVKEGSYAHEFVVQRTLKYELS